MGAGMESTENGRRVNDAVSESSATTVDSPSRTRIVRAADGSGSRSSRIRSISDAELETILVESGTAAVLSCGNASAERPCTLSLIGTGQG